MMMDWCLTTLHHCNGTGCPVAPPISLLRITWSAWIIKETMVIIWWCINNSNVYFITVAMVTLSIGNQLGTVVLSGSCDHHHRDYLTEESIEFKVPCHSNQSVRVKLKLSEMGNGDGSEHWLTNRHTLVHTVGVCKLIKFCKFCGYWNLSAWN